MQEFKLWRLIPLALCALVLSGCSTGGGVAGLFDASPGARFSGSSEKGFFARVGHFCGDFQVGDQPLGERLANDSPFRELTLRLYRGEVSNDEYVTQLLSLDPAPDGNVPAAGCVVEQFNACTSGHCSLRAAKAKAQTDVQTDTIPAARANAAPRLDAEL